MNSMPFRQLKSFLKILIGVQYKEVCDMLYPDALAQTLPMLGKGMVGIFLVIGAIAVVIWLLNKLTSK